jgi:hypothetical protein
MRSSQRPLASRDRESLLEEVDELVAEYRAGGVEGIERFLAGQERARNRRALSGARHRW